MIAFGNETLEDALKKRLSEAAVLRKKWFDPKKTNAYRLINAEGDGIPGLIVDSYDGIFVMQISNPGIEKIKPLIISSLQALEPKAIYEKSTSSLRKREGLEEVREKICGIDAPLVDILENGLAFSVDLLKGQKTGFFLDQRDMRALVRELSSNRRILNCFSYTGGFSIAALAGGASHVDSVEISKTCQERLEKSLFLNHLDPTKHTFIQADVFDFLKTAEWNYDLVILDPPAFVKKRSQISRAFHAYKDLNQHAMQKMPAGSLLLTSSCSYHVDEELFQNILFRAASDAKRNVRILSKHRQAYDHPISLFHPESSYLKSFLLYIE
jgi:23S rRNA (cytosine1962-C5)-methyltransferase